MRAINIEISYDGIFRRTPYVRQGENGTTTLYLVLPTDYQGYKYVIVFQPVTGDPISTVELTPDSNHIISYVLTSVLTAAVGNVGVQLDCYDVDDNLIKSAESEFEVKPSLGGAGDVLPTDYVPWYVLTAEKAAEAALDRIATAEDRAAVTGAASDFTTVTVPAAVQSVTDEGDTQVGRVTAEGDTQEQRVTDEGTVQVQRVQDEFPATVDELNERIDTIITTPISGEAAAQELIDARGGKATLGDRFGGIDSQLANVATQINTLDAKKLEFVTYRQFGAKLNGIDDDSASVLACHIYANENGLPVRQNTGLLYLKTAVNIPVKTDLDLSGCELLLDETMGSNTLYSILSEVDEAFTEPITKSEFTKGALKIPSLAAYENSYFHMESDKLLGYRDGVIAARYNMQEPFAVGKYGNLTDGALLFDYSDATTLTLHRYSTIDKSIIIRIPKIKIDTTDKDNLAKVFQVTRSNVFLTGLTIEIANMPNAGVVEDFKNSLVTVSGYHITIDNFIGNNPSATYVSGSQAQSNYVVQFYYASDCILQNCILTENWGSIESEVVKKITYRDSSLNRVDNHWIMSDMYISNIKLMNGGCVYLGHGTGTVNISKVTQITGSIDTSGYPANYNWFIMLRNDLGLGYEGVVNIDGININSISQTTYRLINIPFNMFTGATPYKTQITLPKFNICNVNFKGDSCTAFYLCYIVGDCSAITSLQFQDIIMKDVTPSKIDITHLMYFSLTNTATLGTGVNTVKLHFENIYRASPDSNFTQIQFANVEKLIFKNANSNINCTSLCSNLYVENSICKIYGSATNQITKAIVRDSEVKYTQYVGTISYFNCIVQGGANVAYNKLYGCVLNGDRVPANYGEVYDGDINPNDNGTNTVFKPYSNKYFNNVLYLKNSKPLSIDGSTVLGSTVMLNNVIAAASQDSGVISQLRSTVGSNYS